MPLESRGLVGLWARDKLGLLEMGMLKELDKQEQSPGENLEKFCSGAWLISCLDHLVCMCPHSHCHSHMSWTLRKPWGEGAVPGMGELGGLAQRLSKRLGLLQGGGARKEQLPAKKGAS